MGGVVVAIVIYVDFFVGLRFNCRISNCQNADTLGFNQIHSLAIISPNNYPEIELASRCNPDIRLNDYASHIIKKDRIKSRLCN